MIGTTVMTQPVLHTDDTPIRTLAPGSGKTRLSRFWVYAVDPRSHAGAGPSAAFYRYSADRKGEQPREHLAGFSGVMHADAFAGYDALYRSTPGQPPRIQHAACWAYTLIETAKLNGLNPEAYLAYAIDQLTRGHLASRLSQLLPWNCKDAVAPRAPEASAVNSRDRLTLTLHSFLPYEKAIPSHDTLRHDRRNRSRAVQDVLPVLGRGFACRPPDVIAIDGKTSRRSHARGRGRLPLLTVSAWTTRQRLVRGPEAVAEKSNEILAIPLLPRQLELTGAVVTIDGRRTQRQIAQRERQTARSGEIQMNGKSSSGAPHETFKPLPEAWYDARPQRRQQCSASTD